jgi:hypothetical protein
MLFDGADRDEEPPRDLTIRMALSRQRRHPQLRLATGLWSAQSWPSNFRADVGVPEVLALLIGMCQAAMHTNWSPDLQEHTLAVVFHGLRPPQS